MLYRKDQWVWQFIWLGTFSCCFPWVTGRLFSGSWFRQCYRLWRIIFFLWGFSFALIGGAFWLWVKTFMRILHIRISCALSLELFFGTTSLTLKTSHASLSSSSTSPQSPQPSFSAPPPLFLPILVTVLLTTFSTSPITFTSSLIYFFHALIFTWLFSRQVVCVTIWKRLVFWPLGLVLTNCPSNWCGIRPLISLSCL